MIFDEAHFITASLSTRLRAQDICRGGCGELLQAAAVSAKRTLAAHLQLLRGLLRVPSDLICGYCGRNFARNPALISPRNTCAASAFVLRLRLAVARLPRGSKFYAENRKISRLNVVAEIFQKIYTQSFALGAAGTDAKKYRRARIVSPAQ